MCREFIVNLLKAINNSVDNTTSNEQILVRLQNIEKQLERQERTSLYRYQVSIGIGFIGLGLGASLASVRHDWLMWVLVFGGIIMIALAGITYRQDIRKKTAIGGFTTTFIGLAISTVQLYSSSIIPPCVFFLGLFCILIGLLLLIIASSSSKMDGQRDSNRLL